MRSAIASASSCLASGSTTANSSPPNRQGMSKGRSCERSTAATPRSTASPARCPYVLFTSRSRSRSASTIDSGRSNRRARSISAASARREVPRVEELRLRSRAGPPAPGSGASATGRRRPAARAGTARSPAASSQTAARPTPSAARHELGREVAEAEETALAVGRAAGDPEHLREQHVVDEDAGYGGDRAAQRQPRMSWLGVRRGRRTAPQTK